MKRAQYEIYPKLYDIVSKSSSHYPIVLKHEALFVDSFS